MSSTVGSIIEEAFRESGMLNELQFSTPAQTTQALNRLQNLVSSSFGFEVGEPLYDWMIGNKNVHNPMQGWSAPDWSYPMANVRLIAAHESAQTIYLPANPGDGARIGFIDPNSLLAANNITIDGNGRRIDGGTTKVLNTDGTTAIWFYRADLGEWVPITPLDRDGDFPFPPEFDDYFITMLAMRLNPRYGRGMSQENLAALERSLTRLRARYQQVVAPPADPGAVNLTSGFQSFSRYSRRGGPYGWMN